MSNLEVFGSTSLRMANWSGNHSPGTGRGAYINLPVGGAIDELGNRRATAGATRLVKEGLIFADTHVALEARRDELRALRGKRDKLYKRMADDSVRWCWARCDVADVPETVGDVLRGTARLSFTQLDPRWRGARHGDGWYFDDGELLDVGLTFDEDPGAFGLAAGGTTICELHNGGDDAALGVKLTITAGTTTITEIHITATVDTGDIDLLWPHPLYPDTIAPGKSLVIDQAALMVRNDGADSRTSLARTEDHTIVEWLRWPAGTTEVSIEITAPLGATDPQAIFTYYDGHS